MQTVLMRPDELRAMLTEVVATELAKASSAPEPPTPEYLSRKGVAEVLGISLTTVDTYAREGLLRKHRHGGLIRFRTAEVLDAMRPRRKRRRYPAQ